MVGPVGVSVSYWVSPLSATPAEDVDESPDHHHAEPSTTAAAAVQSRPLHPHQVRVFHGDDIGSARMGLPLDVNHPSKPLPGDYSYSGMHDQGPLPKPREGGCMSQLIACVQEATTHNDEFLTQLIRDADKAKVKAPPPGQTTDAGASSSAKAVPSKKRKTANEAAPGESGTITSAECTATADSTTTREA